MTHPRFNRLSLDLRLTRGAFRLKVATKITFEKILGIVGPSGSGKSTLLHCIAGLLRASSGRIVFNETTLFDTASKVNLPPQQRRIGYIFQDSLLFPHYRVRGNLLYGAPKSAAAADFAKITELLGLGGLLARRVGSLSGGERRRVALGRALLSQPRFLVLDEPLTGIDASRRREILDYIRALQAETEIAALYVSHDQEEMRVMADQLMVMAQGQVVKVGPCQDLLGKDDPPLSQPGRPNQG
ncbi:MAG: ATP-binding cassette domain-containing protein [Pseudomonadota bacterium]